MISKEELKRYLKYDSNTGYFTWIELTSCRSQVKIGDIAGSLDQSGYVHIKIKGKKYTAHRLAWLYVYGKWPTNQIDHINRVRNDNRIVNLRDVNHRENCINISTNKSGYPGVSWHKERGKWRSQIKVNGKVLHLGYFKDVTEAAKSRKEAELKYNFYDKENI